MEWTSLMPFLSFLKLQKTLSSVYLPFVRFRNLNIKMFLAAGMLLGSQNVSLPPPAPAVADMPPAPAADIPPAPAVTPAPPVGAEPPEPATLEEPPVPALVEEPPVF